MGRGFNFLAVCQPLPIYTCAVCPPSLFQVYHTYLEDDVWHRTDGSRIKGLHEGPLTPAEAEVVYGASLGRAWVCASALRTRGVAVGAAPCGPGMGARGAGGPEVHVGGRLRPARAGLCVVRALPGAAPPVSLAARWHGAACYSSWPECFPVSPSPPPFSPHR